MGLPGHRRTSSDKRRRASHFALQPKTTVVCGNCGAVRLPHHACTACGFYRGRNVLRNKTPAHSHMH